MTLTLGVMFLQMRSLILKDGHVISMVKMALRRIKMAFYVLQELCIS